MPPLVRSVADAMDKSSYVEFITSLHSRVQHTCESDPVMLSSPRFLSGQFKQLSLGSLSTRDSFDMVLVVNFIF